MRGQGMTNEATGARAPSCAAVTATVAAGLLVVILLAASSVTGCKGSKGGAATDGSGDGVTIADAATGCPVSEAGTPAGVADDFGPNAKPSATATALAQLNIYEVTSPRQLEWVDLYLRVDLDSTRLTIAVYEAPARNAVFHKLTDVQVDVPRCQGWVPSGPLAIPMEAGRFYAVGFDPNQTITPFVDSETSNLPVDGQFGRLIGSNTSTSVSVDTLDWGTPSARDFNRQRVFTSPRAGNDAGADSSAVGDAAADAVVDLASDRG